MEVFPDDFYEALVFPERLALRVHGKRLGLRGLFARVQLHYMGHTCPLQL